MNDMIYGVRNSGIRITFYKALLFSTSALPLMSLICPASGRFRLSPATLLETESLNCQKPSLFYR